ncbi:putative type IV secretion system protein VirB4 [Burkholderia lata]|uniref:Putative type IV secretion system protein VirB4 n=2 Tax=Bacteria TaxID=2 RepID=A0A6P2RUL0_BURL3|nr:conjugal transfer protein TrbE [Burkholderia lata]VWC40661.1 putative type IV secretion system protein VirB4 [Burkholderia lata]
MTVSSDLITNETPATKYIPYRSQLNATTCTTIERDVTSTIQFRGIPFETMSKEELDGYTRQWFSTINTLGANNARVALWSHLVRRKLQYDISGIEYDNSFSEMLGSQYAERVGKQTYYVNELFLSPVYRPAPGRAERIGAKLDKKGGQAVAAVALEQMERITAQLVRSMRRFQPTVLGVREFDDKPAVSDLQSFYGMILNGEWSPVPLDTFSVRYGIQRNDLNFGTEVIEIMGPTRSRYAGIIGLKAPYGAEMANARIFHPLLRLPCEFILSQSLTFMPFNEADKFLEKQINNFSSTDEAANAVQLKQLRDARSNLAAGKFGMGQHEFILTVYGDSIKEVNEAIGMAVAALEEKSMIAIRKRRGKLISQYFSMLPGNFLLDRLDAMPISTDNFAAFFPMHNFMTGRADGSQWGMPITVLKTTSGAPYFFNYHVSRKSMKDQGVQLEYVDDEDEKQITEEEEERAELEGRSVREHRKELGNYTIIGPSGSGKTLTKLFLRALLRKRRKDAGMRPIKTFAWDKDYGEEILVCAMGGKYFRFEDSKPSGLNPFGLPDTPQNRSFIMTLLMWCAESDPTYTRSGSDEETLLKVIGDVYDLPTTRRLSRIMDTLPGPVDAVRTAGGVVTGLKAALRRWVGSESPYGWVLDNAYDRFDLTGANDFGFDMTSFLDNAYARTPIQLLINHKIESAIDGSPFVLDITEAWKALKDPYMQLMIENKAKTVRKQLGLIGLDTQDPTDLTTSPIKGTLLQQFPTQIYLPNDKADRADYIDGMKLTAREFKFVTTDMLEEPGQFLLKQGKESVVVRNDLSGMDDMNAVLSASIENVMLVRDLIEKNGDDPNIWLPKFFKTRS